MHWNYTESTLNVSLSTARCYFHYHFNCVVNRCIMYRTKIWRDIVLNWASVRVRKVMDYSIFTWLFFWEITLKGKTFKLTNGGCSKGPRIRPSQISLLNSYCRVGMLNADCPKIDQVVHPENGDENLEQNLIIILYNNGHHSPLHKITTGIASVVGSSSFFPWFGEGFGCWHLVTGWDSPQWKHWCL